MRRSRWNRTGKRPHAKGLPEKTKRRLLDPKTWQRDTGLFASAEGLRKELGGDIFEDHNLFRDRVDEAVKKLELKLSAADLKSTLRAVSWRVETAPPVVSKAHKAGKAAADPLHGRYPSPTGGGKLVLEYEPDTDLRDTEQVPLLDPAASRRSSVAKSCRTRLTPGGTSRPPRSATRSVSPATSTSRNRCAHWRKSGPTFSLWKRRPEACWMNSSMEAGGDPLRRQLC